MAEVKQAVSYIINPATGKLEKKIVPLGTTEPILPTGYEKIAGAYNNRDLQQKAYSDIQQAGNIDASGKFLPGSYLMGKRNLGITPPPGYTQVTASNRDLNLGGVQRVGTEGTPGSFLMGKPVGGGVSGAGGGAGGGASAGALAGGGASGMNQGTGDVKNYMSVINQILLNAQMKNFDDSDLIAKRNALVQKMYNESIQVPPELKNSSPDVINGYINQVENKYKGELNLIDTALENRDRQRANIKGGITGVGNILQNQYEMESKEKDENKPIEVGNNLVKFNPTTGKYEVVYQGKDKKADDTLSASDAARLGVPFGTTISEAALLGIIPKSELTGTDKINMEVRLAKDFETYLQPYRIAKRNATVVDSVYKAAIDNNFTQQAMTMAFNKILDTLSVVRETEYARTSAGQSYIARIDGFISRVGEGGTGLTKESLTDMYNVVQALMTGYDDEANKYVQRTKNQVKNYGLVAENILTPEFLDQPADQNQQEQKQDILTISTEELYNKVGGISTEETTFDYNGALKEFGSEENLRDLLLEKGNFNNVDSDTNEAEKISEAIGQFESGGRYNAIGQTTKTGDKAYGKYQIMGANIPSWSKEVLGNSISIQEFLSSPKLQDKIAKTRIAMLYTKYGNINDVASVWFSGRPLKNDKGQKDILGTSIPQYVQAVNRIYKNLV